MQGNKKQLYLFQYIYYMCIISGCSLIYPRLHNTYIPWQRVFQAHREFHKILNETVSDVYMLRKVYQTETWHIRYGPNIKDFVMECVVTYFTIYTLFKVTPRFVKNEVSNLATQRANSAARNVII